MPRPNEGDGGLGYPSRVDPTWTFDWCKTWRKPYDHVVAACLLVAQRILGEQIEIGADGKLEDFLDQVESREPGEDSARELYTRVFGEPPVIPPWFTRSR